MIPRACGQKNMPGPQEFWFILILFNFGPSRACVHCTLCASAGYAAVQRTFSNLAKYWVGHQSFLFLRRFIRKEILITKGPNSM